MYIFMYMKCPTPEIKKKLPSGEIVPLIVHAFYFQALYSSCRDYFYRCKNFTAIPLRSSQYLFNIYCANTY